MDDNRTDILRLIEAAKCLALMPGSLADRITYAHTWYVSEIDVMSKDGSYKEELKEIRKYWKRFSIAGGLEHWLANESDETIQDYAIAIWDAYYAAALKPAGF